MCIHENEIFRINYLKIIKIVMDKVIYLGCTKSSSNISDRDLNNNRVTL